MEANASAKFSKPTESRGPPAIGEISKNALLMKRTIGQSTKAARNSAAGAISRANRRSVMRKVSPQVGVGGGGRPGPATRR